MTVPCTCRIPDPVVVNGTCYICYGERPTKPPPDDLAAIKRRMEAYLRDHSIVRNRGVR